MAHARITYDPNDRQTGLLSGIVGHELNNIAGALQGFTEIALNSTRPDEPVTEYLGEMRIAIRRIHALAHDLESLGEFESIRTAVPIGECLQSSWTVDWRCDSGTLIDVDALHARRALAALGQLSRTDRAHPSAEFLVTTDQRAAAQCASCGAAFARTGRWVEVRVRSNARIVSGEAVRNPFGAAQTGRMINRLTLAALVHSAHCAGGHVVMDEADGLLGLVFAVASSR